ncbi:MAG: hypothetical protein ABSC37_01590 [Xanthobacteraceae bacterium]|jgi:hypothetical protein
MSVIPIDTAASAASGAAKPRRFWQRFAQALDRLVVYRTKRAVPEIVLRRCKHDIDRCRRLMLHGCIAPADARINRGSSRRAVQTMQTR